MITNEQAFRYIEKNIATVQTNLKETNEILKTVVGYDLSWDIIVVIGNIGKMLEVCDNDLGEIKTIAGKQKVEENQNEKV